MMGPWSWEEQSARRRGDAIRLLLLSGVVVAVVAGFSRGIWLPNLHNGLLALSFASVGAYVLHQQPENRCGTAFLATGIVEAAMFLGRQIGHRPRRRQPVVELARRLAARGGLALVTLSVILFPDGSLPSLDGAGWSASVPSSPRRSPSPRRCGPSGTTLRVVTPHPFALAGADAPQASGTSARPTFVAFQIVWLVAVVTRWRR